MNTINLNDLTLAQLQQRIKNHENIVKNTAKKFKSNTKLHQAILHHFTLPNNLNFFDLKIIRNTLHTKKSYFINEYTPLIKTEYLQNNPIYTSQAVRQFVREYNDKQNQQHILELEEKEKTLKQQLNEANTLPQQIEAIQQEIEQAHKKRTKKHAARKNRNNHTTTT